MKSHQTTEQQSAEKRDWQSAVHLIGSQAATNPDALAVARGSENLSYGDLDRQSNRFAHYLLSLGLEPGMTVGLCLDHCVSFIVAALGILKAGAAYLPLDPADPSERLSRMLEEAEVGLVITDRRRLGKLAREPWKTVEIGDRSQLFASFPTGLPAVNIWPSMLAYLIYTSGSTGKPKAVEVTHSNLMNLVLWHRRAFDIRPTDHAPFLAAVNFDAAVWEIWPYLAAGASLHLPSDRSLYAVRASLHDWLIGQKITIAFLPTPLAEQMIRLDWPSETPLRIMLTGADSLHERPQPKLPFKLVNNYGPTEATVVATSGIVEPAARNCALPSIGKPIDKTRVYILDENLQHVPAGTIGELYIGGAGVARGYRNDPELTAQKFVRDPFSANRGDRMYRTGDLGYLLDDGQIMFAGRADDQFKIRGRRVEMNEIIAVLGRHPGVEASAVLPREDATGHRFLVGYIVENHECELTPSALREFLCRFLPGYMVPKLFVRMDSLPLTSHGKLDRKALPAPDADNTLHESTFTVPSNELEARLRAIITGLLGTKELGVHENFFLLGGDSLLGIELILRLREAFGVEVPLRTLFEAPTIRDLSGAIAQLLEECIDGGAKSAANITSENRPQL